MKTPEEKLSDILLYGNLTAIPEEELKPIHKAFNISERLNYKWSPRRKYQKFVGFTSYMQNLPVHEFYKFVDHIHGILIRCKLITY
jgi:hypothetical protein